MKSRIDSCRKDDVFGGIRLVIQHNEYSTCGSLLTKNDAASLFWQLFSCLTEKDLLEAKKKFPHLQSVQINKAKIEE